MTTEDILAMLRDGDSIEDIGNHFAKLMNAAKAQYDQEQKASEALKLSKLTKIIADLLDWIDEYVTPIPDDEDPEVWLKNLLKPLMPLRVLLVSYSTALTVLISILLINSSTKRKK